MTMNKSKSYFVGLACLAAVVLVGCKSTRQATPTAAGKGADSAYTSKIFTTSYAGALDASSQLMLGMLKLEGTDNPPTVGDNAITSEQAKAWLPPLQSLQGQALKADVERNAVLAHVEAQLTPEQSSAIATMHLTQADLQTWTQNNSQGPGAAPQGMPGGAGPQGTPGAGQGQGGPRPQGTPGAGPGQGGPRPQGTPGAGPGQGGPFPQGTPGARSGQGGSGQPGGSGGAPNAGGAENGGGAAMWQSNNVLNAVLRLLTSKAGLVAPPPGGRAATPTPTKP